MAHIFHRSLISHAPDIRKKAELLVHTYGSPDQKLYPDTIGQFWEPFHHNYAYGITKIQIVANILNAMKVGDVQNFALWYDSHMKDTWNDVNEKQHFEAWFKNNVRWGPNVQFPNIRDIVNQDQVIVTYGEHKMIDTEPIYNAGNTGHLITYATNLMTMFFIFGFNSTMNIALWLLVLGIAVTEGLSQVIPVSGSSVIGFELTGAILMGLWQYKSWGVFNWLTFLWNTYSFFAPMIMDPPLKSFYFLFGKTVVHVAHYIGTVIGVVIVLFVG